MYADTLVPGERRGKEFNKVTVNSESCSKNNTDLDIKQHIVKFFNWLNNVQQKCTLDYPRKEKNELLFLLLQLKKQLSNSISLLNMPYVAERQEFVCEICSDKIILEPLQDIWECLENHCHAEPYTNVENLTTIIETTKNVQLDYSDEPPQEPSFNEEIGCIKKSNEEVQSDSIVDLELEKYPKDEIKSRAENETWKLTTTATSSIELNISTSSCITDVQESAESPSSNSRTWYPKDALKSLEYSEDNSKISPQLPKLTIPDGKNNFRFNFKAQYSQTLENSLYPKLYRRFDIDGDPILQKTGPERTVCLTCSCELLNQRSLSNIMSHMSGTRHVNNAEKPQIKSIIRNYHDTFLKLDEEYQSHQIYFATDDQSFLLKCVLCVKYVRSSDVLAHLKDNIHIEKLTQLSLDNQLRSMFHFLEKHLETYGVFRPVAKTGNAPANKDNQNGTKVKQHNIIESDTIDKVTKICVPRRFAQHLKFLTWDENNSDLMSCCICEINKSTFKPEDTLIHLVQPSHIAKSKVQMCNYLYNCKICNEKMHDEITWDLHFKEGKQRHQEAASKLKDIPLEYECLTCKVVLFGDSEAVEKHRQSFPARRGGKSKAITLNKDVQKYFSSKEVIRNNGAQLVDDAESVISNTDIVHKCLDDLENALESKYSNCKAYPFGSRISGLGGRHSDLDIFIDIGSMYSGNLNQDAENQTKIITNVMNLIKKKQEFYKINCIPTARTPIIRLKHRPTNLECDISFVHGLSVENTKFIRYCFEMQPITQELILMVKKWSLLCGLSENISTYALAMLGIFYMQKNHYLLSVQKLKDLNRKNVTIVGWETIDYITPKEEVIKHIDLFKGDIIDLLIGFFKFYSEFNYKLDIVCPLLGEEISKGLFAEDVKGSALPKEMASYVLKVNSDDSPEYFRCLSSFCIQDPFDLSHNLTKACSNAFLDKFVKLCSLSHTMLSKLTD